MEQATKSIIFNEKYDWNNCIDLYDDIDDFLSKLEGEFKGEITISLQYKESEP